MKQSITKLVGGVLMAVAAQCASAATTTPYYQIPNGDFEMAWKSANEPGNGFHSFEVSTASSTIIGSNLTKNKSVQCNKVEGHNGGSCARITSLWMSVIGVEACPNGNLTTGNIYGGAMSAADKNNHNKTIRGSEETSLRLATFPDSITYWYKFAPGYKFSNGKTNTKNTNPARCQLYVHGDIDFRDQEDQFSTANVTKYQYSKNNIFMAESADWKYCAEALTYTKSTEGVKENIYLLLSFATNATPSGSYDDNLWVDDVKLVYSSKLSDVSFGIVPVEGFDKDVYSYEVMFEEDADLEAMAKAANVEIVGRSAKYTTSYNSADAVFTITVEGADISVNPTNKHTYTFEFKKKAPKLPEIINIGKYTDNLVSLMANGKDVNADGEAQVDFYDNYYSVLTIKDAVVDGEKVGDIVVDSLPYKIGKDSVRLSGKRNAMVGAKTMSVEVSSATSSLDYKKLKAILNIGDTKITYGYLPPVDTLLSETRSHWLLTFVKGVGKDTVQKSMTMRFMENGMAMIQIPAVKIGAITLGDLTIDSIPYTEKDGVYDLKGDGVASYTSNLSSATGVRLGKRMYGVVAQMTADTMTADIVFDVSGTSLGSDVTAEFGKYVHKILPKVVKPATYTDYLIVSDANGETEPTKATVKVDYYDNALAVIDFGEVTLPNGEKVAIKIDSVGYETTDSMYVNGRRDVAVDGIGTLDFSIEGVSNLSCFKLRMTATSGSLVLSFGTYESPTFDTLKIKELEITDNLAIFQKGLLYHNQVVKQKVYVDFYNTEKADLYIKDFYLDDELMGDLEVMQVPYTIKGDSLYLETETEARFKEATGAIGSYLGVLPLKLKASVSTNYDKMTADIKCDFANTVVDVTFGKRVLLKSAKYTDNFEVTVNGKDGKTTEETITIDYFDDNTARLSILGFKVGDKLVGDIVADGFEYEKTDSIRISGEMETEIKSEDKDAIGPTLGKVPVNLMSATSSNGYKKLRAFIEIDMTETTGQVVDIKFGYPLVPDPEIMTTGNFKDTMIMTVNGIEGEAEIKEMQVDFYDNGMSVFTMRDIVVNDTLLGDLVIDSIPFEIADTIRMSGKRIVEFESDNNKALGAMLGKVAVEIESATTTESLKKMYAKINIDLDVLGKEVKISYGYDVKAPVDTVAKDTTPVVVLIEEKVYDDTMVVYVGAMPKDTLEQEVRAKFMSDSTVVMVVPNIMMDGQLLGDMTLDELTFAEDGDSLIVSGEQTVAFATPVGAALGSVGVKVDAKVGADFEGLKGKFYLDIKSQKLKLTLDYGAEIVEEVVIPEDTTLKVVKEAVYADNMVLKVDGEKNGEGAKCVKVTYYSDGRAVMSVPEFVVTMGGEETVIDSFTLSGLTYETGKDSIRISGSEKVAIKSNGVLIANGTVEIVSAASSLNYRKMVADLSVILSGVGIEIGMEFGHKVVTPPNPGLTFTVPDKVTYTDSLVIIVNGKYNEPMIQDINVEYAEDGTCTLSIVNFTMKDGDDVIEVGDVIVKGLPYTIENDSVRISGQNVVTIDSEMGEMLGAIPVVINSASSSLDKQKLECNIGIDMSATLGQILTVTFGYTELHRTPLTPIITFTVPDEVTYTDSLVIIVNGKYNDPMIQDINVEYAEDGTCTLSIINFTMKDGDDVIEVGDVIVTGLPYTIDSDSVRISGQNVIKIDSEMGEMLGEIPVIINSATSSLDKMKLECNIGIDMSATLGQVLTVTFGYTSLNRNPIIPSDPANDVLDTVMFNDSMYIYVNGEVCSADNSDVKLIVYKNGTMDMVMYNVHTKDEDGIVLLGNAKINGLKYTKDSDTDDYIISSKSAKVTFGSSDPTAVGAYLGEMPCNIETGWADKNLGRMTFKSVFAINKQLVVISYGYEVDASIENVATERANDGRVYTISGVYVGKDIDRDLLPKGMYIIGGEKVYIRK